jgi:hypothetical protein
MPTRAVDLMQRNPRRALACVLLAGLLAAVAPAASPAAITTFGSPLSVPATLNTAENLGYPGTFTPVPPNPEAPNGLFHTFHYGADTALLNVASAEGVPQAPATGQAVKVSLEGCAEAAPNGPSPLTQIHFQDVSPLPNGAGAKVNITSQGFEIPVCGQNGASGSTVSTYEPINLCVSAGDFVDFNDEGGYVPNVYRNGVAYQVLGSVSASTMDSFIRGDGTGNGATLSSSFLGADEGFAVNRGAELMLRVTLGTGSNATHICAGGTAGAPPVLPVIRISPQTDGINAQRIVAVAVYCRPATGCDGVATMSFGGHQASVGNSHFSLRGDATSHLPIRLAPSLLRLIRAHNGVNATLTAVVAGKAFTQTIAVKIL